MEFNFPSLLGVLFFVLAFWLAWRVRRDLATGETSFERALFGGGKRIRRDREPVRFWCAVAVNTGVVLLFALVGAAAFRTLAFAARRFP